jgi:hypothetical protein
MTTTNLFTSKKIKISALAAVKFPMIQPPREAENHDPQVALAQS